MSQVKQSDEAWFLAAKTGDLQYIQDNYIKLGGKFSKDGMTALQIAAKHNQPEVAKLLAHYEARIQSTRGYTALMFAAKNDYVSVVKILAPLESRIISKDTTAIILASRHGSISSVKVLLHYEYLWIGQALNSAHISGQFEVANYLQEQIQFPQQILSYQEQQLIQQTSGVIDLHDLDNSTHSGGFSQQQGSNTTRSTLNSQIIENDNVTKYFKFTETIKEIETKLQNEIKTCAANQRQNIQYLEKIKEQEHLLQKAQRQFASKQLKIKEFNDKIKQLEEEKKTLKKDIESLEKQLIESNENERKLENKLCMKDKQIKDIQQEEQKNKSHNQQRIERLELENKRLIEQLKNYAAEVQQLQHQQKFSGQASAQYPDKLNQQPPPDFQNIESSTDVAFQPISNEPTFKIKSVNY